MPSKLYSAATIGLDAKIVEVEVDLSAGLHSFSIVGLPDKAVEESKERVNSAIKNSEAKPPRKHNQKVIINLAPANVKKQGPAYDLPIAIGFLLASKQIKQFETKDKIFIGELALDGSLRPGTGVLSAAILAKSKNKILILPEENFEEANLVEGLKIAPVGSLKELIGILESENPKYKTGNGVGSITENPDFEFDMGYIKGQSQAKRAAEIAAAGGHNMLLSGTPGSGKTMIARAMPSILPSMSPEEIIEVTKIYSTAGLLSKDNPTINKRPFRSPHHSISNIALIGGGTVPQPGEVSLAHKGIIFLDELPEFPRQVLEALRQPMEDGQIMVARVRGKLTFPASFTLVAAQNPCPCGYYGDHEKECICSSSNILKYKKKVSGPLIDRIDLHLKVNRIDLKKLTSEDSSEEPSEKIRKRAEQARQKQLERFAGLKITTNAEMSPRHIKQFCKMTDQIEKILWTADKKYSLSARAYHKILKIARTVADIDGAADIRPNDIAEALQYRPVEN